MSYKLRVYTKVHLVNKQHGLLGTNTLGNISDITISDNNQKELEEKGYCFKTDTLFVLAKRIKVADRGRILGTLYSSKVFEEYLGTTFEENKTVNDVGGL